jgi:hypothetical protein
VLDRGFFFQTPIDPSTIRVFAEPEQPGSTSADDLNAPAVRRALKDVRLEFQDLRRRLTTIETALGPGEPPTPVALAARSATYVGACPTVSVLMAVYNYACHVEKALDSVARCTGVPTELVVVDDASTDGAAEVVAAWIERHPEVPAILIRHGVNRGLARARNAALSLARGEFCFILDADNEVYPFCLERLHEALRADQEAAMSYGILERFNSSGPFGLLNTFPWERARFRTGNYIDAMAMIRTRALREMNGYALDPRLHGWEDFDLWCRVAESGGHGAFVREIVARYRTSPLSMLGLTNLSATDAFSLIIETCPTVMAGVTPPE